MKLMDHIFGPNGILAIMGVMLVMRIMELIKKALWRKKNRRTVLMLPSGDEHRHLIEASGWKNQYTARVVIRRAVSGQE